jgi:hypothetical protein
MELQKREKILLGVMGVAVSFFLLNQFVFSKKTTGPAKRPPLARQVQGKSAPRAAIQSEHRMPKLRGMRFVNWRRDPFVGAFTAELLDSLGFQQKVRPYVLKAISWKNGEAYVLINDTIIKVGETVNGLTVVSVDGNRAICEKNRRKFSLILGGNDE